jgi:hypothetical protein
MKSKFETLLAGLVFLAILGFPVVLFLVIVGDEQFVSGKQECIRRDRESLLAALKNIQSGVLITNYDSPGMRPFDASRLRPNIGGTNYQCILATDEYVWEYGLLAITTNQVFIWLDKKQGPKIITDSYKVPRWRMGF